MPATARNPKAQRGFGRELLRPNFPSLLFLILTIAQYLIRYPENSNNDIIDWSRNEIKRGYNVNKNNDENNDSHGTSSVIMNRFF